MGERARRQSSRRRGLSAQYFDNIRVRSSRGARGTARELRRRMSKLPEFVRDDDSIGDDALPAIASRNLTGWETVVFQLLDESDSDSVTAAIAP